MKLTLEMLKEATKDQSIIDWFIGQNDTDFVSLINKAFESGSENILDFFNFRIARLLDRTGKIKYAVFAAEQVIGIFEKKYPDDKRPREAIDAAKKAIENDTKENRKAADTAEDAVYNFIEEFADDDEENIKYAADEAVSNAAWAAMTAVGIAARRCGINAIYSAHTAGYASNAAYADAAFIAYSADEGDYAFFIKFAAYAAYGMRIKILRYGITLIEEMKKK